MQQIQLSDILLAGKKLLSKYSMQPQKRNNFVLNLNPQKNNNIKRYTAENPFEKIFKNLKSAVNQITKGTEKVDYYSIVKKAIPDNAVILTPKYPANSRNIEIADIDGDKQNELLATYKDKEGIKTLILKKTRGQWEKFSEIKNPEYDTLHYRSITDISGQGKKQLLLGLKSEGRKSRLYGYSHENNTTNQLFALDFNKFQVLKQQSGNSPSKVHMAIWNMNENDAYNVEVLNWNGSRLETVEKPYSYYFKNVAPFYAAKINQNPYSVSNWYNLAEALVKSNAKKDALLAINVGMRLNKDSTYKERFASLKDEIFKA